MSRATQGFIVFAILVSLGCVRLGLWQVARLGERKARNAAVVARLGEPPLSATALAGDTAIRFRRVTASGRYDFAHELVLAMRPRNGSPGVQILTPLRLGRGDSAVLVNRGWVYAADGTTIALDRWRESEDAVVEGFAEPYSRDTGAVSAPRFRAAVRRLDFDSIQARMPYPLLPLVMVQQLDSGIAEAARKSIPIRTEPPPLNEGPHRAYAVQWFAFAVVGFVGTLMVATRDRMRRRRELAG